MTKTYEHYVPAHSEAPKSRNPSYYAVHPDGQGLMSMPSRMGASYVLALDYDVIAKEVGGCRQRIRELEAEKWELWKLLDYLEEHWLLQEDPCTGRFMQWAYIKGLPRLSSDPHPLHTAIRAALSREQPAEEKSE